MKIIGAGLPRTGTMSTQAALNRLGFRCYHMQDVPREPGHLKAWNDYLHGYAPMDWKKLFGDYDATVDAPACFYFEEIMNEFPEAMVLLTIRDADGWHKSVTNLLASVKPIRPLRYVIPKLRRFLDLIDGLMDKFVPSSGDLTASIAAFHQHNEKVRRIVPERRLLVFDVREGWAPLCSFLKCKVPKTEFPRLNTSASVSSRLRNTFLSDPFSK